MSENVLWLVLGRSRQSVKTSQLSRLSMSPSRLVWSQFLRPKRMVFWLSTESMALYSGNSGGQHVQALLVSS